MLFFCRPLCSCFATIVIEALATYASFHLSDIITKKSPSSSIPSFKDFSHPNSPGGISGMVMTSRTGFPMSGSGNQFLQPDDELPEVRLFLIVTLVLVWRLEKHNLNHFLINISRLNSAKAQNNCINSYLSVFQAQAQKLVFTNKKDVAQCTFLSFNIDTLPRCTRING